MSGTGQPADATVAGTLATQQIAGIGTDPNRLLYGKRIEPDDATLAARGQSKGLALYDELERDPQVGTVLGTRKDAIIGREWTVDAGAEDGAAEDAAELVRQVLAALPFNQVVGRLLGALLRGLAVAEVMWEPVGDVLRPVALLDRDPRRFAFRDGPALAPELRLLTRASPFDGVPVPARKFVLHRHGGRYENPWGLGLGHRLFWPVWFKRQGIGFWLSALEKFGQPTTIGRYPAGTLEAEQDRLLEACRAVQSEAGVIIPEGMMIELLEAKNNGTFDSYATLARYMDDDIAKAVLGQTLTSSAGEQGSRALGQVHDRVRIEISKSDADELSDTLNNGLLRWIVDLNRPGYADTGLAYPRIWWDVSVPEDLTVRATRDKTIFEFGYRPTEDYVRETYGEGWEPVPPPPPPPIVAPAMVSQDGGLPAAAAAFAALFAEARGGGRAAALPPATDPRDTADLLTAQLGALPAGGGEPILRAIEAMVAQAESLEAVRDGLLRLYPGLPVAQFAELLGQALVVADLTGRGDASEAVDVGD